MLKNKIIYNPSSEWRLNLIKAKGSFLWDDKGNKFIDFTSGWNVTNLGWNNSEIKQAIINQARKNIYAPMETTDVVQKELAEYLTNLLPKELNTVGRATGGTEANEEAIKTARAFTRRKKIIGFKDTYHGQSYATMSLGYLPEYIENMGIGPMVPEFIQLDFPNTYRTKKTPDKLLSDFASALENILRKKDIAAIVTEAGIITGWGSTYLAPNGYLKLVSSLTKKYGTLLILDEVGTGFSRLGKLFGMQIDEVIPDIVTFAKGLSNGAAAIGAMVTKKEIAEKIFAKTNLTSTFGWTPIACAAALKVLQIHKRDKVWEKAKKDGEYLLNTLKNELKNNPSVGDIRGIGMEIGIDFVKDIKSKEKNTYLVKKIISLGMKKGLYLNGDFESNIQLMPPLTIDRKTLDQGLEILIEIIKKSD